MANWRGTTCRIALVWATACVGCGRSSESSGGVVAATANMHLPRIGHTQTRLLDGRVLIVGGLQTVRGMLPPANNDVEIFDPAEGRFRVVAQMKTVRIMHADTLLADGRTVFTGGTPGRKVDVFDPRTGKLEAPGALRGSRAAHTATLLADGRILLVGGFSQTVTYHDAAFHQESKYLNSMEVYDPRSGSARVLKCSLNAPRRGHTASLLGDGRVLIIGGTGLKRTELIDVASESVTWGPSLAEPREDHRTVRLTDGRLLVTGGSNQVGRSVDTAEIMDPAAGLFRALDARMNRAREDHTADLLDDGRVLITGGEDNRAGPDSRDLVLDDVEVFDPRTESFTRLPPLSVGRDDHRSTPLAGATVLVTGGENAEDDGLNSVELIVVPPRANATATRPAPRAGMVSP